MNTNQMRLATDFQVETRGTAPWPSEGGTLLAWAKNRLAVVRRLRQRRRAIGELSRMPDWQLRDMGIPRDQIAEVVDGLIAREGPR